MTTPQTTEYRMIDLTRGQQAKVSEHRFERLNASKWFAFWNEKMGSFYACRNSSRKDGKRHLIYMHREILGLPFKEPTKGDHWNGDTLDNTDDNLRRATSPQNSQNMRRSTRNRSGFKGVSFNKRDRVYIAQICCAKVRTHLGTFKTPEAAYEAYCAAAKIQHGEFARTA